MGIGFDNFQLTDQQIESVKRLSAEARALTTLLLDICPEGRERALALTNLEVSLMWAGKAIVQG